MSLLSNAGSANSRTFKGRAMSPARFAEMASKGKWYCPPHLDLLNDKLLKVATGEITRQATFMPPRHGKSLFRSMWFPAWYLGTFPDREVILASYNADFAAEWGQKVRDLLENPEVGEKFFGIKIRQDRRASDSWGILGHDGGMKTCGVGGGLTGKGASLLLIDDPVKDAEDALSPALRQRNWDWYVAAADTRLEPGGAICVTMTPWHADDLGGRILEHEAPYYDVLRLPALPDGPVPDEIRAERKGYDRFVGAPDALGRQPGVPLWGARYDATFFARKKAQDPFWFDALFNCQPRARDGNLFKRAWFDGKVIAQPPREGRRVRYWDTAASDGSGDWTVGVLMACHNQLYYVEHVERFRLAPGSRDERIRDVAIRDKEKYGYGVETWIEQGGGGGGKSEAEGLVKNLAGFHVNTNTNQTNKKARAIPFASQCEAGNVKLVAGRWLEAYLEELTAFRGEGTKEVDDQVDATSGAFARLALSGGDRESAYYNPAEYDIEAEYGMEVTF